MSYADEMVAACEWVYDGGMEPLIILDLSRDEGIVLFEFLSRYSETGTLAIEDQAEMQALNNLLCKLEKEVDESFSDLYAKRLDIARMRLRPPQA